MAKKKNNFKCPECGEEFDTERGMKIHESRSHKSKSSSKKSSKKSGKSSSGKKKKDDTVIHVKFDRPEAVQSKRDLLFAQRELLEILKHVKKYHLLRKKELTLKTKAKKRRQEVNKDMNDVKKTLLKVEIAELLKKEEKEQKGKGAGKIDHSNIDKELDDIQKKLAQLEQSTQVGQ